MSRLVPDGIMASLNGLVAKVTGAMIARAVAFVNPVTLTTVGNGTLTAALLAPGNLIQRTGPTGAFTETTATAAQLTAAYPEVENGQSYAVAYSNMVAQTATYAGGTGVTIVTGSKATNAGSGLRDMLVLTKTSATAWTLHIS